MDSTLRWLEMLDLPPQFVHRHWRLHFQRTQPREWQNQAEDIRDRNKLSQIHSPEVRWRPSAGTLARKAAGCRHCLLDLVVTSRFIGVQETEGRACFEIPRGISATFTFLLRTKLTSQISISQFKTEIIEQGKVQKRVSKSFIVQLGYSMSNFFRHTK